jgi:hypothetical protein
MPFADRLDSGSRCARPEYQINAATMQRQHVMTTLKRNGAEYYLLIAGH